MAAPTLIIKTAGGEPATLIKDLGITIPGGGSPVVTFNDEGPILEAAESDDLRVLVAAGTLILNDGTSDLAIGVAEPWLDSLATPSTSSYAVILAGGSRPFVAQQAGVDPTAPAHLTTKQWVESQVGAVASYAGACPTQRTSVTSANFEEFGTFYYDFSALDPLATKEWHGYVVPTSPTNGLFVEIRRESDGTLVGSGGPFQTEGAITIPLTASPDADDALVLTLRKESATGQAGQVVAGTFFFD